jgi:hypothetical protein
MKKYKTHLLLQLPLLLLGSCTPVIPATSITVYTNNGGQPGQYQVHDDQGGAMPSLRSSSNATPIRDCVTAIDNDLPDPVEIGLPNLSKIEGKTKNELNKAVVDLLLAHIKLQRNEITRMQRERKCLIAEIRSKRV